MTPSILRRRVEWSCPWFDIVAKETELDPPRGIETFYAVRTPDQVVVLAITEDDRVPLVRQFRPVVETDVLELPSGGVEADETPEQAARRELWEETGCEGGVLTPLGCFHTDSGRMQTRLWAFLVTGVSAVGEPSATEQLDLVWTTPRELTDMVQDGQFPMAVHIAAVASAQLQGRLAV